MSAHILIHRHSHLPSRQSFATDLACLRRFGASPLTIITAMIFTLTVGRPYRTAFLGASISMPATTLRAFVTCWLVAVASAFPCEAFAQAQPTGNPPATTTAPAPSNPPPAPPPVAPPVQVPPAQPAPAQVPIAPPAPVQAAPVQAPVPPVQPVPVPPASNPPPVAVPPKNGTETAPDSGQPRPASEAPPAVQPHPVPETPAVAPPRPATETPAAVIDGNTATTLLGKPVQSSKGEALGRVVDVVVDRSGSMLAVIVDFGGFLGVGTRKIAVDWHVLHFPQEGNMDKLTADLPHNQLQSAPAYREGEPFVIMGRATAAPAPTAPPVQPAPAPVAPPAPPAPALPAPAPPAPVVTAPPAPLIQPAQPAQPAPPQPVPPTQPAPAPTAPPVQLAPAPPPQPLQPAPAVSAPAPTTQPEAGKPAAKP
jgi:hypothetical protein